MQLNELKKELSFNTDLLSLVETLKNVAGSQYHLLEKKKERFDLFMESFSGFFRVVDLVGVEDPLVKEVTDVLGVVVVTSDSGFMGGLNKLVIEKAMQSQEDLPASKVKLIVIGDKGAGRMGEFRREFKFFQGINQDTIYEQAVEIKDYLVGEVLAKRIGRVVVAYPAALSFSSQEVRVVDLLPCASLFDETDESKLVREETEKNKGATGLNKLRTDARKVVIESSFADIVEYLAGMWVTSKLFEVFEDGKLAEFSARAMHLEGSLSKIEEDHGKVKRHVFKAVHELIDKGMRESYSAKAIKEKKAKKKKKSRLEKEALRKAEEEAAA